MTNLLDRLLGRQPARKAVYGGSWLSSLQQGPLLSSLSSDPKERMAKYLQAYRVGWFYKAGSKISRDVAGLDVSLSYEDEEGDNESDLVAPANNVPFESLTPPEQLLRLMERPNPGQTGRQLRAKTQIRLDFAGAAFWYLEGADGGRLPTAIYGISPTRMDPSLDKAGNLIGWVMDRSEGNPGIPFTPDEIVPFSTSSAMDEWYGVSVVEAVYTQVPLTDMIARHTADVLTTGGRLAGMMWPKDRALDETEFQEAARAWRNVASDPNAARRLLLFPEPMEYAAGAATPKDIGIPELAALNREEITTAFPVNPYMLGLPLQPGMNSGESLRYVTRDYWANTIHDRAELFEETLQIHLVPRYEEATGRPLDLDLEQPDLDNAVEVIEKTGALQSLISLGFDPKDAIRRVGLDYIAWNGLPTPPTPTEPGASSSSSGPDVETNDSSRRDTVSVQQTLAKAVKARREEVVGEVLPGFVPTMERFLRDQRDRVVERIEQKFAGLNKAQRKAAPDEDWWDPEIEDAALLVAVRGLYLTLSRSALSVVADDVDRVVMPERINRVTTKMLETSTKRLSGINEATFEAIKRELATGVMRGYSLEQLVKGNPAEGFRGIGNLAEWEEWRAERVARTETMLAYNESALLGYKEYGYREMVASDGDFDEVCQARNGAIYSVDEALDIHDHPNGTLEWLPVTDKAVDIPDEPAPPPGPDPNLIVLADITRRALNVAALKSLPRREPDLHITAKPSDVYVDAPVTVLPSEVTVNVPAQKAPDVTVNVPESVVNVEVAAPEVNVAVPDQVPPIVNVTVPESVVNVNVPAQKAPVVNVNSPGTLDVRVTEMPDKVTVRDVVRDKAGNVIRVVDQTL